MDRFVRLLLAALVFGLAVPLAGPARACCCKKAGHCAAGAACCTRKTPAPARAPEAPRAQACCAVLAFTVPEPARMVATEATAWAAPVAASRETPAFAADPFKVPLA